MKPKINTTLDIEPGLEFTSKWFNGLCTVVEVRRDDNELDAADFGTPVKKNDENWNAVFQLFHMYGDTETKRIDTYSTGATATFHFSLMKEDGEDRNEYHFDLFYVTTRGDKKQDGYVFITSKGDIVK
jgi:hypothetical protein